MGYKCSFLDSESYTAQDVNDIFAHLVTGGVVFGSAENVLEDLNNAQNALVSEGVTKDVNSCKVVKTGGIYKISKGACFMGDGSAIVFDDGGEQIEITPSVRNYVFLRRNSPANTIDIVVSQGAGEAGTVPLAEIDSDGNIFDRRRYARAKVDLNVSDRIKRFSVNFTDCTYDNSETVTVDVGEGDFSHLVMFDGSYTCNDVTKPRVAGMRNFFDITDGVELSTTVGEFIGKQREHVYITKNGQYLSICLHSTTIGAEYTLNIGVI